MLAWEPSCKSDFFTRFFLFPFFFFFFFSSTHPFMFVLRFIIHHDLHYYLSAYAFICRVPRWHLFSAKGVDICTFRVSACSSLSIQFRFPVWKISGVRTCFCWASIPHLRCLLWVGWAAFAPTVIESWSGFLFFFIDFSTFFSFISFIQFPNSPFNS